MWGFSKHWKRPGLWALVAFAVVIYGNACAPNFTFMNEQKYDASLQTCRSDESLLNDFSDSAALKTGYLGSQKVSYIQRDDDWIQVHGDMLIKAKGALPTAPLPAALQQGVGVRAADRWPNGAIPYVISGKLSATMVSRINAAVQHWNTYLTGVLALTPRTTQSDYVLFTTDPSGCASAVGYFPGAGVHPVYLSTACDAGNVVHEIGHVVGLDHEQNRLDRDNYVTINLAKVSSGYSENFVIVSDFQNYNVYDFGSIMHYSLFAFSKDGSQTITPKVSIPTGVTVGQRKGLTYGDIDSVRLMYGYSAISANPDPDVVTPGQGLTGRYYNSFNFQDLKLERTDAQVDFNWAKTAPVAGLDVDTFSVRWTGYVTPPTSGTYSFVLQAMDEVRIVMNGQTLFEMKNGNSIQEAASMPVTLNAGTKYSFLTEYRASTANASSYVRLYWRKPDGTQEIVPASVFSPDSAGQVTSPCSASWLN